MLYAGFGQPLFDEVFLLKNAINNELDIFFLTLLLDFLLLNGADSNVAL